MLSPREREVQAREKRESAWTLEVTMVFVALVLVIGALAWRVLR